MFDQISWNDYKPLKAKIRQHMNFMKLVLFTKVANILYRQDFYQADILMEIRLKMPS